MQLIEQQILSQIQTEYRKLIKHPQKIQNLPRQIPLSQLSDEQKFNLDHLIDDLYINLLLKVTFNDLSNHKSITIHTENQHIYHQQIQINPHNFSIDQITFNHTGAFIWLDLYFQKDIKKLTHENQNTKNENFTINKFKKIYNLLSLICMMICGYILTTSTTLFSKFSLFLILIIGCCTGTYLWQAYNFKTKKHDKKLAYQKKMIVLVFLSTHLATFAIDYLKLDK